MARQTTKTSTRSKLGLETLETRTLLAASLVGSTLQINGTNGADTAVVQMKTINRVQKVEVTLNNVVRTFNASAVQKISFLGRSGDDRFTATPAVRIKVDADGGFGNDVITGGSGNNLLKGSVGNDTLTGRSAADTIYGGVGNDTIQGAAGADILYGDAGNDVINGGTQDDLIYGGVGNDTIRAGAGEDFAWGDHGDDTVYGEADADQLYGGAGKDTLRGGWGDDTLVSLDGAAVDTVYGDGGRDSFWLDKMGPISRDAVVGATANEAVNTHAIVSFVNGPNRLLNGPKITDPTDGTNYKNFAHRWLFASTTPSPDDVIQGQSQDCWLMAGLSSMARTNPNAIKQTITDLGDGTYAVRLGGNYYRIDADLPVTVGTAETLQKAKIAGDGSLWVALIEKAYAIYRTGANTYASLDWGNFKEVSSALGATGTGNADLASYKSSPEATNYEAGVAALNDIAAKLGSGKVVGLLSQVPAEGVTLVPSHVYSVVGVNYDATGTATSVLLRNPWAKDGAGHQDGANDGYVTITAEQLGKTGGQVQWATAPV